MEVINHLLGYENLKIYQDTNMFNFSLDSVLLPNFVTLNKNSKNILDIGAGNAVIPIILSTKTDALITGVEIQEDVYKLAKKSVEYNNLENQIKIINDDIKNFYNKSESDTYDVITCNPPYFKINNNSRKNLSDYKTIARHEVTLDLEILMRITKKLLKNGGNFAMVHRPERLIEIIEIMRKNNIEPKRICFVYPKKNTEANTLLIEGVKNGKPGVKIMEPVYVHEKDGTYTDKLLKYFS